MLRTRDVIVGVGNARRILTEDPLVNREGLRVGGNDTAILTFIYPFAREVAVGICNVHIALAKGINSYVGAFV